MPLSHRKIALSVSDNKESLALGFSTLQQKLMVSGLAGYLMGNGAHLFYGGDLRQHAYTYEFSIRAAQLNRSRTMYTHFLAWPLHLRMKKSDHALFSKEDLACRKTGSPEEVPHGMKRKFVLPEGEEQRQYWASSLSKMRREMAGACDVRVLAGGSLSGYKGFYPGIIEEAYLSLQQRQPLYLIGAFGGATALIIRAIKGESEQKLLKEITMRLPASEGLPAHSEDKLGMLEEMLAAFRSLGQKGLSRLNKLSVDENLLLFHTRYFHDMAYYILSGLKRQQ